MAGRRTPHAIICNQHHTDPRSARSAKDLVAKRRQNVFLPFVDFKISLLWVSAQVGQEPRLCCLPSPRWCVLVDLYLAKTHHFSILTSAYRTKVPVGSVVKSILETFSISKKVVQGSQFVALTLIYFNQFRFYGHN